MKKKIVVLVSVIVLMLMVIVVGIGYYFSNKRTYEMRLPKAEDIQKITFEKNGKTGGFDDEEVIQQFLRIINETKRITKQESIQDMPINVENVIKISFYLKQSGASTVFAYQKNDQYYIEQPYNGIYPILKEEYKIIENATKALTNGSYAVLNAVVVKANEKYLQVMELNENKSLVDVSFSSKDGNSAFKQGQEIDIYYDGVMVRTYPGYISHVDKIEILKQKSEVEIPEGILRFCYSSRNNVAVSIEEFTSKGISFRITDTNELPYDYSLEYTIYKRN